MLKGDTARDIPVGTREGWTIFELPAQKPEKLVSVIEVELATPAEVDPVWGIDPEIATEIFAEFAEVTGAEKEEKKWMEKFGEWKKVVHVHGWQEGGKAA